MNVAAEPITLLVESLKTKINRFIKNAPENVPFSEDEIMNLVKETRNLKISKSIESNLALRRRAMVFSPCTTMK